MSYESNNVVTLQKTITLSTEPTIIYSNFTIPGFYITWVSYMEQMVGGLFFIYDGKTMKLFEAVGFNSIAKGPHPFIITIPTNDIRITVDIDEDQNVIAYTNIGLIPNITCRTTSNTAYSNGSSIYAIDSIVENNLNQGTILKNMVYANGGLTVQGDIITSNLITNIATTSLEETNINLGNNLSTTTIFGNIEHTSTQSGVITFLNNLAIIDWNDAVGVGRRIGKQIFISGTSTVTALSDILANTTLDLLRITPVEKFICDVNVIGTGLTGDNRLFHIFNIPNDVNSTFKISFPFTIEQNTTFDIKFSLSYIIN